MSCQHALDEKSAAKLRNAGILQSKYNDCPNIEAVVMKFLTQQEKVDHWKCVSLHYGCRSHRHENEENEADDILEVSDSSALQVVVEQDLPYLVGPLLARGFDVNEVDLSGWTALHKAVSNGDASVVAKLLEHPNIDPSKSSHKRVLTPLSMSMASQDLKLVELLVQKGAQVDAESYPFFLQDYDHDKMIELLILITKYAEDAGYKTFLWHTGAVRAIEAKWDDLLTQCLDNGNLTCSNLSYLLEEAIAQRNNAALRSIIEAGALLNEVLPIREQRALILAIELGNLETVTILLDKGADPNLAPIGSMCPLHVTVVSHGDEKIEIAKYLIKAGANVRNKVDNRISLLRWSLARAEEPIVRLLLVHGARSDTMPKYIFDFGNLREKDEKPYLRRLLLDSKAVINCQAIISAFRLDSSIYPDVALCNSKERKFQYARLQKKLPLRAQHPTDNCGRTSDFDAWAEQDYRELHEEYKQCSPGLYDPASCVVSSKYFEHRCRSVLDLSELKFEKAIFGVSDCTGPGIFCTAVLKADGDRWHLFQGSPPYPAEGYTLVDPQSGLSSWISFEGQTFKSQGYRKRRASFPTFAKKIIPARPAPCPSAAGILEDLDPWDKVILMGMQAR